MTRDLVEYIKGPVLLAFEPGNPGQNQGLKSRQKHGQEANLDAYRYSPSITCSFGSPVRAPKSCARIELRANREKAYPPAGLDDLHICELLRSVPSEIDPGFLEPPPAKVLVAPGWACRGYRSPF